MLLRLSIISIQIFDHTKIVIAEALEYRRGILNIFIIFIRHLLWFESVSFHLLVGVLSWTSMHQKFQTFASQISEFVTFHLDELFEGRGRPMQGLRKLRTPKSVKLVHALLSQRNKIHVFLLILESSDSLLENSLWRQWMPHMLSFF